MDGWVESGYVVTREDGQPLRPVRITQGFKRAVAKVGLPSMTRPVCGTRWRRSHSTWEYTRCSSRIEGPGGQERQALRTFVDRMLTQRPPDGFTMKPKGAVLQARNGRRGQI